MIDVLLVEDHELFRMGLSMLLSKEESINLVAEAADGLDGVKKARDFEPNVILMDIGLPDMDGIEATQRIKDFLPDSKVLIITSRNTESDVFEAFKAGADGYIMKGASPEQTITAIKSVYEGVGWIDPAIAKLVFSALRNPRENLNTVDSMINSNKNNYGLTDRELDVLALMVEGLSNPQIAEKLFITRATAKAHVHSILQKLCASTRTQATVVAMKEGLV
ncbi:MAG: response regulator transcription factor [bacterium]|nr:response regulator transcription factor [bacterium]